MIGSSLLCLKTEDIYGFLHTFFGIIYYKNITIECNYKDFIMSEYICSRKIDLYHLICGNIPLDCSKPIMPRVPCNKLEVEDAAIERICTAPSLDECLTGIGPNIIGLHFLREIMRQNNKKVDLSKVTLPFTMVKFCVDRNAPDVWLPGKTAKYVPDAWMTQECWLTKPTMPKEINKLWLVDGIISDEPFLYQGQKWNYKVITGSKWSEVEQKPNFDFIERLVAATEEWLKQDGWMEQLEQEKTDKSIKLPETAQKSLNAKILGAKEKKEAVLLKNNKQADTELTL